MQDAVRLITKEWLTFAPTEDEEWSILDGDSVPVQGKQQRAQKTHQQKYYITIVVVNQLTKPLQDYPKKIPQKNCVEKRITMVAKKLFWLKLLLTESALFLLATGLCQATSTKDPPLQSSS
jgi:hypothetical protein